MGQEGLRGLESETFIAFEALKSRVKNVQG